MKKTLILLLTAAMILFTFVPAFAELNPDDVPDDATLYTLDLDNYTVFLDFETGEPSESYTNALSDTGVEGISYNAPSSNFRVVGDENALSGEKSLEVKGYLDARIWSLSLLEGVGDYIFFEYKIMALGEEKGSFQICASDPDVSGTNSESTGGWICNFSSKAGGDVELKTRASKTAATLERNKVYTIGIAFPVGERTYDLFVDGIRVSEGNKWAGSLNNIDALRIEVNGNYIFDDVIVTYGDECDKKEYFATPTPTPEPTPTPTATPEATPAPTAAPTADPQSNKGGCGSVVVSSAVIMAATLLGAAVILKKKH